MVGLVALIAAGLGVWKEYWSEKWEVRRRLHELEEGPSIVLAPLDLMDGPRLGALDERATVAEVDRALADVHRPVRRFAALVTPRLALDPGEKIARLQLLLNDPEAEALESLISVCEGPDRRNLPDDASKRADVAEASVVLAWLGLLDAPDLQVRADALKGLMAFYRIGVIGRNPSLGRPVDDRIMAIMLLKLRDPAEEIRVGAANVLAFGDHWQPAVPILIDYARKQPHWVNPYALGLWELSKRSDEVVRFAISQLGRRDGDYPEGPGRALNDAARSGPEAWERVERLAKEALRSPDAQVRVTTEILLKYLAEMPTRRPDG